MKLILINFIFAVVALAISLAEVINKGKLLSKHWYRLEVLSIAITISTAIIMNQWFLTTIWVVALVLVHTRLKRKGLNIWE